MELTNTYNMAKDLDAEVLAISTDDLSWAQYIVDDVGVPFPVLYDPTAEVVKQYGVYNLLGDRLATPSTFVIDKEGVIRWKFVGKRINARPSVWTVLDQLRGLGG